MRSVTLPVKAVSVIEGTASSFDFSLNHEPVYPVTFTPTLEPVSDSLAFTPREITFDKSNWNEAQRIVVRSTHDFIDEEIDIAQYLLYYNALGIDVFQYASFHSPPSITIEVEDVDTMSVFVSTDTINVLEDALQESMQYGIKLTALPDKETLIVEIEFDGTQLLVTPTALTFDSVNWSQFQYVNVTSFDDELDEGGNHQSIISHSISSEGYASLIIPDVSVIIIDAGMPLDLTPAPVLSSCSLIETEESVQLLFDRDSFVGLTNMGIISACLELNYFTDETMELFGSQAECVWDSGVSLRVILDDNAPVRAGDEVQLSGNRFSDNLSSFRIAFSYNHFSSLIAFSYTHFSHVIAFSHNLSSYVIAFSFNLSRQGDIVH